MPSAEATSSLLLQQSGAVPRLLQLVAQSSHMQEAADAVSRAARSVSLSDAASLDDIRDTLAQVSALGSLTAAVLRSGAFSGQLCPMWH